MSIAIVWFRRDLRLSDNPALVRALARHDRVLPVYIHAPEEDGDWAPGAASRWWLHHALAELRARLGGRLLLRRGDSLAVLRELVAATHAVAVFWNRLYEPAAIARDTRVKRALRDDGIQADSSNAGLLFEPWEIENRQNGPFRVFTPFWKRLLDIGLPCSGGAEVDLDGRLVGRTLWQRAAGVDLKTLALLPRIDWDAGITGAWQPTRGAAEGRLDEFLGIDLPHYAEGRDRPGAERVSRLSPYLHFGQLGPRECVRAARDAKGPAVAFLRELGWREFAHHLLYHFPDTTDAPLDPRFADFPWRDDEAQLAAWQRGATGIPLVDAGMRQLWETGWMHNRVRMIVASFLTKNLLLPWQAGARWFWDTLVDADLANNSLGWQWTAGCGADAAPYFRVFNPVLQGERFDEAGAYVRQWVPELADLPAKWIHRPWEAPGAILDEARIRLGATYPAPIVDLRSTRQRALDAWGRIRR